MVASIAVVEIIFPLNFLVFLVARLALILGVLLRQRWTSLACFTPEFPWLTWWRISNRELRLILFANSI